MWKDTPGVAPDATDFTYSSQGNSLGYDANYKTTFYLSLVSSVLKITVIML
jgi:hypothetical protein